MKIIKIILTLFLTACGHYVDGEFKELNNKFFNEAKIYGYSPKPVSIYFDDLKNGIAGKCDLFYKDIKIDRNFWSNNQGVTRELLIYHELGHCSLGFKHRLDHSIMNRSFTTVRRDFILDRESVVKDFFNIH